MKILEENYLHIEDFTMLTGEDVYRVGHICFFLGKQINKQVAHANSQKSQLEEQLREMGQKLDQMTSIQEKQLSENVESFNLEML